MKAWQLITHTPASPTYRRLKSRLSPEERDLVGAFRPTEQVWLAWERTAAVALALSAQVVLFQCPGSFIPNRENLNNFAEFFSRIQSRTFALAWEPRGDWSLALVQDLCAQFRLLHCIDPFQIAPADTNSTYWRLHGRGGYKYRYTEEELTELEDMLLTAERAGRSPIRILFNNVWMKDDALRFQSKLQHRGKLVL